MSEPGTTQELSIQEQKQDCGCGCGGYQSSTAKQDCGCGCGGDSCGGWQELVLVDAPQLAEVRQQATSKICYCWTE